MIIARHPAGIPAPGGDLINRVVRIEAAGNRGPVLRIRLTRVSPPLPGCDPAAGPPHPAYLIGAAKSRAGAGNGRHTGWTRAPADG
jgi:hypothetical protein